MYTGTDYLLDRNTWESLTEAQKDVYQFLIEHLQEFQRVPAMEVIAKHLGFSSPNGSSCHMKALYKKGYVDKVSIGNNKSHYVLTKFKVVLQELEK